MPVRKVKGGYPDKASAERQGRAIEASKVRVDMSQASGQSKGRSVLKEG